MTRRHRVTVGQPDLTKHSVLLTMTKIGVLIIQLGTPDEPTVPAVRRYLREFLSDPRVIEAPRWRWLPVLNLLVLPRRSPASAAKYARIWDSRTGSPLLHITRLQTQALQRSLPDGFVVRAGMRYGNPSLEAAVTELTDAGADRLVVLPMYPQYSAASTGTACDQLFAALRRLRDMPAIRVVPPFYARPSYIRAQAAIVREELSKQDRPPDRIVFAFHGYPVDFVAKGDPYQRHVEQTARLLAAELGLADDRWLLAYQSQFGRQVWLQPFLDETLRRLAGEGAKRVLVASPGFTADCLETIDEVGREIAESFAAAGGECMVRCPCLNDHPAWIDSMVDLVLNESRGWYEMNGEGRG